MIRRFILALIVPLLAAANATPSPQSAHHVMPPILTRTPPKRVLDPRWSISFPRNFDFSVEQTTDGDRIVLLGATSASVIDAQSGKVTTRIPIGPHENALVGKDAIFTQTGDRIIAHRLDGHGVLWSRQSPYEIAAVSETTIFAKLRNSPNNSGIGGIDQASGKLRWHKDAQDQSESDFHVVLPEIGIALHAAGEPHYLNVTGIDGKTGTEVWDCFNASFLNVIDGVAICRILAPGAALAIDGYHPAGIEEYAVRGGRLIFSDDNYIPDASLLGNRFSDRPADSVFADRDAVYIGIENTFYRYRRDIPADTQSPDAFDGSAAQVIGGPRFVLVKNDRPYEVISSTSGLAFLPLIPAHAEAKDFTSLPPFLAYRLPSLWCAINIESPDITNCFRLPGLTPSETWITSVGGLFLIHGHSASAETLSAFVPEKNSTITSQSDSHTIAAYADATPLPTEAPVVIIGMGVTVPSKRSPTDLRPRVLSPAARSWSMKIDGQEPPSVTSFSSSQKSCQANEDGFSCQLTISVPFGEHDASIGIYDHTDGHGNLLARSVSHYRIDNLVNEGIPLALHGIIHGLRFDPNSLVLQRGHAQEITVRLLALDADGYPILNDADYYLPILVNVRQRASAVRLSTKTIRSSKTPLVLHYDGSNTPKIFLTASVPGSREATLTIHTH